jgi:hypothetical protein
MQDTIDPTVKNEHRRKKNTSWSVEFQAESTEEEKQSEEERDRKREVFILGELSFDFEYCPWFY